MTKTLFTNEAEIVSTIFAACIVVAKSRSAFLTFFSTTTYTAIRSFEQNNGKRYRWVHHR